MKEKKTLWQNNCIVCFLVPRAGFRPLTVKNCGQSDKLKIGEAEEVVGQAHRTRSNQDSQGHQAIGMSYRKQTKYLLVLRSRYILLIGSFSSTNIDTS